MYIDERDGWQLIGPLVAYYAVASLFWLGLVALAKRWAREVGRG